MGHIDPNLRDKPNGADVLINSGASNEITLQRVSLARTRSGTDTDPAIREELYNEHCELQGR